MGDSESPPLFLCTVFRAVLPGFSPSKKDQYGVVETKRKRRKKDLCFLLLPFIFGLSSLISSDMVCSCVLSFLSRSALYLLEEKESVSGTCVIMHSIKHSFLLFVVKPLNILTAPANPFDLVKPSFSRPPPAKDGPHRYDLCKQTCS